MSPLTFTHYAKLCVTLYEWEHIAEQWQTATHYTEKALYKVLTKFIVPDVTEMLRVRVFSFYVLVSLTLAAGNRT
jgi:hypothetical protein